MFRALALRRPTLETLDYTIRIGSTSTFIYFDLYLYSADRCVVRLQLKTLQMKILQKEENTNQRAISMLLVVCFSTLFQLF